MAHSEARCLILACGNTLRSDDGLGPWLAARAQERFAREPRVRVIARQQWTPDLAEDVAAAESVVFVDCSMESAPGKVQLIPVTPAASTVTLGTHELSAAQLLALGHELYGSLPADAILLTIGAASIELGETFSNPVQAALPEARSVLESTVARMLRAELPGASQRSKS
ncbi:MAG TPA: hydrogenase maturation protease [Terracidiphilus sp.]|jgi:hydrogenase maturation protease|nr:hydrogenase maturation protease [Terracidiphilus sp.]